MQWDLEGVTLRVIASLSAQSLNKQDCSIRPKPLLHQAQISGLAIRSQFGLRQTLGGLEDAQINAMFDAAVAQASPTDKHAICAGMQGLGDKAVKDAPARVMERLGKLLRLPAVPASQCKFDLGPFVVATQANAILYTVKVETRNESGDLIFWATATYGNLGANGAKFRLVRENGRWIAKATGASVIS